MQSQPPGRRVKGGKMNVWNKVLMALIAIMCVVFGVFAANKYNLTKEQEGNVAKLEAELAKVRDDIQQLRYDIYGGPEKVAANWRELGLEGRLTYLRGLQNGEAFSNCQPVEARIDEEKGSSTIAFAVDPQSKTTAFRAGVVAFVFDSGAAVIKKAASDSSSDAADAVDSSEVADSDATDAEALAAASPYAFLGAFKVTGANDAQVNLESIGSSSADELTALKESARSGRSWVVYADRLPIDSPADLAYFESESPERVKALPAETASFVTRGLTFADVEALGSNGQIAADSRFPVDFQGALERGWFDRDEQNVINARNTMALETFTNIIADQYVAMGEEVKDEDVLAFENWDDVYAAALARKKVDSWQENIAKTKEALTRMEGYRDLVKKTLDAAEQGVADCRQAIDELIVKNAETAAKIAAAQFLALEKVEAESKTVSNTEGVNSES